MASKGNILRGHHSEPDAGYEKSLPDAALTVGTISRALSDSKAALAASTKLAEDVDDLDELIASIEKSTAEHRAIIQRIESGRKATANSLAKLRAAIDNSPATLAKAMAWERDSSRNNGRRRSRRATRASTLKPIWRKSRASARCGSAPSATTTLSSR